MFPSMTRARIASAVTGAAFATVAVVSEAAITAAQLEPISDDVEASVTAVAPWALALAAIVLGFFIGLRIVKRAAKAAA